MLCAAVYDFDMERLQDRLKQARTQAGLTQAELAKKVGISQPTYSELESGRSDGTKYILRIAAELDVNPFWLAEGKGQEKQAIPAGWQSLLNKLLEQPPAVQELAKDLLRTIVDKHGKEP